ncbi:MAG: hypothetical protein U0798_15095 [Gemmataceae bacterium]
MKTDKFGEVFKTRGGRINEAKLSPFGAKNLTHLTQIADSLVANAQGLKKPLSIQFGFIENASINACATRHDDEYFVGVHWGSVVMMDLTLSRILANRKAFTRIGDVNLETEDVPIITNFLPDAAYMFAAGNKIICPRDPVRQAYVTSLLLFAYRFLLGHEFAHVVYGHIDLLIPNGRTASLTELDITPIDAKANLTRQVIEWDADCSAASVHGAGYIRRRSESGSNDSAWSNNILIQVKRLMTGPQL